MTIKLLPRSLEYLGLAGQQRRKIGGLNRAEVQFWQEAKLTIAGANRVLPGKNPRLERAINWTEARIGKLQEDPYRFSPEFNRQLYHTNRTVAYLLGLLVTMAPLAHSLMHWVDRQPFSSIDAYSLAGYTATSYILGGIGRRVGINKLIEQYSLEHAAVNRFKAFAETTSPTDLLFETGIDGQILYVSPSVEALMGYNIAEVVKRRLFDVLRLSGAEEELMGRYREALSQGFFHREITLRAKNGRAKIFELNAMPYADINGQIAGFRGIARDITERKQLEIELRVLFDNAPIGLANLDSDGRIQHANNKFCALLGYTENELRHKRIFDLIDPSQRKNAQLRFTEKKLHGKAISPRVDDEGEAVDRVYLAKDGHQVIFETIDTIIRDQEGNIVRVQTAFMDLTEQAALTAEKIKLIAELSQALEELKQSNANLIQAGQLAAVGELNAGVAHEINNPLAGLLSQVEIALSQTTADDPFKRQLEFFQEQILRIAGITEALLETAKPAEGEEAFSVSAALNDALALKRQQLNTKYITIQLEMDPLLNAFGSRKQLSQVFLNLIVNAEKAINRDGIIRVSAHRQDQQIVIWVEDTGPGIQPQILNRIFEPFFTTRRHNGGTGLGLSISYQIVQNHGGELRAENRAEGGARFIIILPLSTATICPGAPMIEPINGEKNMGPGKIKRILFVEDETIVRLPLSELLRDRGFEVIEAENGQEALDLLKKHEFDLIISDLEMPVMGGEALVRNKSKLYPDIPVIIMTGYGETPETKQLEGEKLVARTLKKPVLVNNLLVEIEKLQKNLTA